MLNSVQARQSDAHSIRLVPFECVASSSDMYLGSPTRSRSPFDFLVYRSFPQKLLIGTTFCGRHIDSINPNLRQISLISSLPLPIFAFNDYTTSVIHNPHPLTTRHTSKEHFNIEINAPTHNKPFPQRLVPVNAPIDELLTIDTRHKLYITMLSPR